MLKKLFTLLVCLYLTGCQSLGRGIAEEVMDESKTVTNLGPCVITGYPVDGVNYHLSESKTVKVLMIHGIGTHYPGYSKLLQENLAQDMGLEVMSRQGKNISLQSPDNPSTKLGNLRITFLADAAMKKKVLFYELTWSEITQPQKQMLEYDYSPLYASRRVLFNEMLKRFLDNALPDAVFYMSDRNHRILQSAEQAMCWMLKSNDWDAMPEMQKGACQISPQQQLESIGNQRLVFVTHSLGSKIFIDSFSNLSLNLDQAEKTASPSLVKKVKNKPITVFMMANQLPLLQLWYNKAAVNNQISSYCTSGGSHYSQRAIKRLNIVAFNDPNDLLTYTIEPEFVNNYIDSRMCPEVTNISINVTSAVSAFGVDVVNPVAAHIDYDRSRKVIDIISQGTRAPEIENEQKCRFIRLRSKL